MVQSSNSRMNYESTHRQILELPNLGSEVNVIRVSRDYSRQIDSVSVSNHNRITTLRKRCEQ